MSEFQYHEFKAVDKPLNKDALALLRRSSSRAHVTPTSFSNEYSYGDLKGDPAVWMERYFDAHLFIASWGTRVLDLGLSVKRLSLATARRYCDGGSARSRTKAGKLLLSFVSDDDDGEFVDNANGQLQPLLSLRSELASGDLRCLYLGWLLRVQNGEIADDLLEPPIPPSLGRPGKSLKAFVEFLHLDQDLVHAASLHSEPVGLTRSSIGHRTAGDLLSYAAAFPKKRRGKRSTKRRSDV